MKLARSALIVLALAALPGHAAEPGLRELGFTAPAWLDPGQSRFAVADVDDDGEPDIVVVSHGRATPHDDVLVAFGRDLSGDYSAKQVELLDTAHVARVLARPGLVDTTILLVRSDGIVIELGDWPLRELRRFQGIVASAAAVGDLDRDGNDELVVVGYAGIAAYDLQGGGEIWRLPSVTGSDVALGSFDFDPELEIATISSQGIGMVVEPLGPSIVEWTFTGQTPWVVTAGRFGPAFETQFVASSQWNVFSVFDGRPWRSLWSKQLGNGGIETLHAADFDGDGRDEIVQGDGQYGDIHVVDAATRVTRFRVPNPDWGIRSVAAIDLDDDPQLELVFARGPITSSDDVIRVMRIVDTSTGSVQHDEFARQGSYNIVATGDVDADGSVELVVAGRESSNLFVVDLETGEVEWQAPVLWSQLRPQQVMVDQLDADPALEIVLVGGDPYDGRVAMFDGVSHAVELQLGQFNGGPFLNRSIVSSRLVDTDGNGSRELLVLSDRGSSADYGLKFQVLSLPGGVETLRSAALGATSVPLDLLVANTDGDPQDEWLVVAEQSVRAFDSLAVSEDWSLPVTATGASLVAIGDSGSELAVINRQVGVSFFDLATREPLRSLVLPAPVTALSSASGGLRALLACAGGRLRMIDGRTGAESSRSRYLGLELCEGNQIAVDGAPSDWRIGVGGAAGYFRLEHGVVDAVFMDGFESR